MVPSKRLIMADVNLIVKETLNITCMKNDSFVLDMDWKDASDNPIDLTAYTFKAQVKRAKGSNDSILTFLDSDFTKDASGNLTMTKSSAEMDLEAGVYYYDMQTTKTADGTVSTWLGGTFTIQSDVTT
jgi:D-Tyr-tRNAtyr deacylase